jgi:hypothetical protein
MLFQAFFFITNFFRMIRITSHDRIDTAYKCYSVFNVLFSSVPR